MSPASTLGPASLPKGFQRVGASPLKAHAPVDGLRALTVTAGAPAAAAAKPSKSAHFSAQGPRPTQEDKHIMVDDGWTAAEAGGASGARRKLPDCSFYAVFDGHGGKRAAQIASRELWKNVHDGVLPELQAADAPAGGELDEETLRRVLLTAFYKTEEEVLTQARRQRWEDGCTACSTLL